MRGHGRVILAMWSQSGVLFHRAVPGRLLRCHGRELPGWPRIGVERGGLREAAAAGPGEREEAVAVAGGEVAERESERAAV